jgi:hypothetical protein
MARTSSSQLLVILALLVATGCSIVTPSASTRGSLNAAIFGDCRAAFRAWVDGAASLNSPDGNLVDAVVQGEAIQRRIFELCTLEEAERFNREMPIEQLPGVSAPMIEPDFRTFAEVECVDESPLLDGTPLCAEVGH